MARPANGASGDFQGVVLLAAAATRFANVVTSFLSSGSLMSETAFPGSTHCVKRCSNLDLAVRLDAVLVKHLVLGEQADRFCPDLPSDAGFLEGFARGRFRRPQPLDRPTLRNDPAFGRSRGDEEDFERRCRGKPIWKRGVLDAKGRPDLAFVRFAGNRASPDSPACLRFSASSN
jgi:hypothetical protein